MTVVNHKYQDDYFKVLGQGLYELIMNDKFTDLRFVTMNSSGKNIRIINAHQFVFCTKSPFLQELCREARAKQLISDPVVLTLPGVSASSVLDLINYFYLGEADFNSRKELKRLCDLLGIVDVELDDSELNGDDFFHAEREASHQKRKQLSLLGKEGKKSKVYNKETGYYSDGSYLNDCSQCSLFFVTEKSYLSHIDSHNEEKSSSKAEKCQSSLVARKSPRYNDNRILRSPSHKSRTKSSTKNSKFRKCKFCDRVFKTVTDLRCHTIVHFRMRIMRKLPSTSPYRCPDCSKVMSGRYHLFRHYSLYHRHILKYISESDFMGVQV